MPTLADAIGGKDRVIGGPFGSKLTQADYVDFGIPVIRGSNMPSAGRRICGPFVYVSKCKFDHDLRSNSARRGDIIVTQRGTLGQVGIIGDDIGHETFVVSQSQMAVRVDARKANRDFVYYFLISHRFNNYIKIRTIQAGVPHINLGTLREAPVAWPNISAQAAIAEVLASFDDKIELNRRMNETLEAMARALFKDWFVDFGPTRAKMEGRAPYLAPDIWSLFPDRLDDEGKPEGWMEKPLTKFFEIVGGGTPKTSESGYWGGDIPWFSVVDTPSGSDIFVFETEKSITDDGLRNSSARLLDRGGTIISARGTVGNLAMVGRPMAFNQSCYGLKGANGYGPCFVFLAAKHMVAKLQSLAHGSVFSTITRQTFDSVYLPAPGIYVAKQFDLVASALFERMRANVAESHTLAATRDFLLPKLMSGEVRIKDAATLVGEVT
ncbi:restriction endonuclease subunit S [Tistrella sp. BH-R2-4]|uniref:Restriction endonuclease subunit S n=1 Tax=Tistrella arctica TaxID=3133430 RepID=A0ABU9YFQ2_9PROT